LCDLTAKLEEVTKLMDALKLDLAETNLLPPGMDHFVQEGALSYSDQLVL